VLYIVLSMVDIESTGGNNANKRQRSKPCNLH
jgi:hypothetical protein